MHPNPTAKSENLSHSWMSRVSGRSLLLYGGAALVVAVGFYVTNWHSYVIFHTGAELFIAIIAASVFVVGWNGRRYLDSGFYMILAVSCLFIAVFHALHLLSYKGLEIIGAGSNTATQLWLASRFLMAFTLILAPFFVKRRVNVNVLLGAYAAATGLLLLSIFTWGVFPESFREGAGLTTFKVVSECVISAVFLAAMGMLYRQRKSFDENVFRPLLLSVGAGIAAEVFFMFYRDVYGIFNMLGHLLVLLSFVMIYKALVEVSLRRPYQTLFRELKRSEERYKNLVELSPDAVLIHRENSIVFANTAAVNLLGASDCSALLALSPFDVFDQESHPLVRQRIGLLVQGGTAPLAEVKIRRLDGESRTVEIAASPLSDLGGAAIQMILRDVTDRKLAEEALRESEQRFRSVVESNMIGVVFANPKSGQITDANDEYLRIIGRQRSELEAGLLNYREITPPDMLARQDEITGSVPPHEVLQPFQKEYVRPDGSRVPAIVGGSFLDDTGERVVAFVLDYSEHKEAERERDITIAFLRLVNETHTLEELIRASVKFFSEQSGCEAVGIRLQEGEDYPYYGTTGFSSEFVRAESSLCVICGGGELSRDSEGRAVLDCLCGCVLQGLLERPPASPAGSFWTNSTSALLRSGQTGGLPQRVRGRCNTEGYESVALIPLHSGEQTIGLLQMNDRRKNAFTPRMIARWERLAGYLAVALAKARAEEALRESADSLARSNKDLEHFAYVASHDLQEPLRQIAGFVRLLEKNYSALFDDTAREFFDFVQEGANRMQSLINDLLQYSRVGRRGTEASSVDLNEVCHTASRNLQARIEETGARIAIKPLPQVRGNPTLLAQVFQNLLANSLKFQGQRPPEIEVAARQQADEWLVWVKDNGIGFDKEHAENIFVIFQRLHARGKYEGTGLGLAICKRAIEQHGGRIWAESKPNQGATFYFTLPAARM